MYSQSITLVIGNEETHKYSIDQHGASHYEIGLQNEEWYGGKSPTFDSADDAFLFVLKILSWVGCPINQITTDCTFIDQTKIIELCKNQTINVNCY
jgi:hypothetical protein